MSGPPHLSRRAAAIGLSPISQLMHKALANPELIALAAGFVDQASLPVEATRAAVERLYRDECDPRAALQYGTTAGYPPLRQAILDRLRAADGQPESERDLSIDQVVITAGSNQMLHLLAEVLFDPGDIVLCAAPSYFVFLGMLADMQVRTIGVAGDQNGLDAQALDETLRRIDRAGELSRVKALYLVSYFDNPAGTSQSRERRPAIVDAVRRWSRKSPIYILEDAAYRELRYDGHEVPSLRAFDPDGQTVIHTHTFSKSFSPGLRVGWGVLPRDLVEPVCNLKGNIDFGSPNWNQHLMAVVLAEGLFDAHVDGLQASYRAKRDAMWEAASEHLLCIPGVRAAKPAGGLYLWVELPPEIETGDDSGFFRRAMDEGVLYVPGEYCYPGEPSAAARHAMRLSFGVQPIERLRAGVAALGRALRQATPAVERV